MVFVTVLYGIKDSLFYLRLRHELDISLGIHYDGIKSHLRYI